MSAQVLKALGEAVFQAGFDAFAVMPARPSKRLLPLCGRPKKRALS